MVTVSPSLPNHLVSMIEALVKIVAREGRRLRMPRPLIVLVWSRLARLANRFLSLVDWLNAGKLPPAARRRPAAPRSASGPLWRTRHVAWVLRTMKPEVATCAGTLEYLLSMPEMTELIREVPQVGRILRPLCKILGVKPTAELVLPRRAPAPPSARAPSARANPLLPRSDPLPPDPPDAGPWTSTSEKWA
jgi:hypothetical protein